jgi:hypothetical protein
VLSALCEPGLESCGRDSTHPWPWTDRSQTHMTAFEMLTPPPCGPRSRQQRGAARSCVRGVGLLCRVLRLFVLSAGKVAGAGAGALWPIRDTLRDLLLAVRRTFGQ